MKSHIIKMFLAFAISIIGSIMLGILGFSIDNYIVRFVVAIVGGTALSALTISFSRWIKII